MKRVVFVAKVLGNEDGDKLGAAKVQMNDLVDGKVLDDKDLTPGRYPFAGNGEGFYYAPQTGALLEVEVLEDDEEGVEDLGSRWVGMLYTSKDAIPEEFQSDATKRGGIKFGEEVFLQDKTKGLTALISLKVRLGEEEASHPLVRGDTYNTELTTYLTAEDAYLTAESTEAGNAASLWTALKAALQVWAALPPGVPATTDPLIAFATALQTAVDNLAAGGSAWTGAIGTFKSAVNAFKNKANSWLSTKCKTE